MAAGEILNLKTSMGERAIRLLYAIALILIGLGVLMGLGRGVAIMTHAPMQRPAVTAPANPQSGATATPQPPQNRAMQNARPGPRGFYRDRFRYRHRHFGMMGRGMVGRSPALFGLLVMIGALVKGFIALLIVRVLAEMGLAVLAMPRRAET